MNDEDYQFNLAQVRRTMLEIAPTYDLLEGLVYTSPYDFVAQHGRDYRPAPWISEYKLGRQLHCFGNALCMAGMFGLRYIEGFTLAPTGMLLHHGWNATRAGELIDVTWANTGLVYVGVEFSVERADDAMWNGEATVLNDENRNYPIFQQRWQGEDYTLEWPYSDRLEALRNRSGKLPPTVSEWLKTQEPTKC